MYRKALITSLTLAAAAGAISCTAATAAETPTQSGSITISDNGQPNRDQTRSLTVALITKNGAGNAATTPELVTASPAEAEAPAEEPARKPLQKHPLILHSRKGQPPKRKRPPRQRHLLRKRTTPNLVKRPPLRAKQLRVKWKLLSRPAPNPPMRHLKPRAIPTCPSTPPLNLLPRHLKPRGTPMCPLHLSLNRPVASTMKPPPAASRLTTPHLLSNRSPSLQLRHPRLLKPPARLKSSSHLPPGRARKHLRTLRIMRHPITQR